MRSASTDHVFDGAYKFVVMIRDRGSRLNIRRAVGFEGPSGVACGN